MATPERIKELEANIETLREEFTPGNCNLTLHDDLSASFSDLYKSINGFRPRWVNTSEMTELEILIMMDDLVREEELKREWEAEQERMVVEEAAAKREEELKKESEPEWKQKLSSMRSMKG
jgi:hypothetical protein